MERQSQINIESWWGTLPLNPFRLFFPLGIFCGVVGVGIWVLWSVNWDVPQPALLHAFFQTEGFLACFVVGFLMTALPRFSGTDPVHPIEIMGGMGTSIFFIIALLKQKWMMSQVFFLFFFVNLIFFTARRLPHRTKDLPPSFVLLFFGFLHAVGGTSFILVSRFGTTSFPIFQVGRQMVQLGFLLCIVLGVTGQLAPFLFGHVSQEQSVEKERESTIRHRLRSIQIHTLAGLLILGSFFIDLWYFRGGASLRAVVVTWHLFMFAKIGRPLQKKTTLLNFFYVSCWMIPAGLWTAVFFTAHRIAAHHIVFIGGFSLMIFSFGMFIVLAHSRRAFLINEKLSSMTWIGILTLLGLWLRWCAEIFPVYYKGYIHTASGLWVVAAIIWAIITFPKILDGLKDPKRTEK